MGVRGPRKPAEPHKNVDTGGITYAPEAERNSSSSNSYARSRSSGQLSALNTRLDEARSDFSIRRKLFQIRRAQEGLPSSSLPRNLRRPDNQPPFNNHTYSNPTIINNHVETPTPSYATFSRSINPNDLTLNFSNNPTNKNPTQATTQSPANNNNTPQSLAQLPEDNPIYNHIHNSAYSHTNNPGINPNNPCINPNNPCIDPVHNPTNNLTINPTHNHVNDTTTHHTVNNQTNKTGQNSTHNPTYNPPHIPVQNQAHHPMKPPVHNPIHNLPNNPPHPPLHNPPHNPPNIPPHNPAYIRPMESRPGGGDQRDLRVNTGTQGGEATPINNEAPPTSEAKSKNVAPHTKEAPPTHCTERIQDHSASQPAGCVHVSCFSDFATLPGHVLEMMTSRDPQACSADHPRYRIIGDKIYVWPHEEKVVEQNKFKKSAVIPDQSTPAKRKVVTIIPRSSGEGVEDQALGLLQGNVIKHAARKHQKRVVEHDSPRQAKIDNTFSSEPDTKTSPQSAHRHQHHHRHHKSSQMVKQRSSPISNNSRSKQSTSLPRQQHHDHFHQRKREQTNQGDSLTKGSSGDEDTSCMPPPPSGYHIRNDNSISESSELRKLLQTSMAGKVPLNEVMNEVIILDEKKAHHMLGQNNLQSTENDTSFGKSHETSAPSSAKKTKNIKRKACASKSGKPPCKVLIIGKLNYHKNSDDSHRLKKSSSFCREKSEKRRANRKSNTQMKKEKTPEKRPYSKVVKTLSSQNKRSDNIFPLSEKTVNKYYKPQSKGRAKKLVMTKSTNRQINTSPGSKNVNSHTTKSRFDKNQSACCRLVFQGGNKGFQVDTFSECCNLNKNFNSCTSQSSDLFRPQVDALMTGSESYLSPPGESTPVLRSESYHTPDDDNGGDNKGMIEALGPVRYRTTNQLRNRKFGTRNMGKVDGLEATPVNHQIQCTDYLQPSKNRSDENLKNLEQIITSQIRQQKEIESKIAEAIVDELKNIKSNSVSVCGKGVMPSCSNETLQLVSDFTQIEALEHENKINMTASELTKPKIHNSPQNITKVDLQCEKSPEKASIKTMRYMDTLSSEQSNEHIDISPNLINLCNRHSNPILDTRTETLPIKRAKSCESRSNSTSPNRKATVENTGKQMSIIAEDKIKEMSPPSKCQERISMRTIKTNEKLQRLLESSDQSVDTSPNMCLRNRKSNPILNKRNKSVPIKRAKSCGSRSHSTSPNLTCCDFQRKPKIKKRKQRQDRSKTPSPNLNFKSLSKHTRRQDRSKTPSPNLNFKLLGKNTRQQKSEAKAESPRNKREKPLKSKDNSPERIKSISSASQSRSVSPPSSRLKLKRSNSAKNRKKSVSRQISQTERSNSTSPVRDAQPFDKDSQSSIQEPEPEPKKPRVVNMSPMLLSAIGGRRSLRKKKKTAVSKSPSNENQPGSSQFIPWRHTSPPSVHSNSSPMLDRHLSPNAAKPPAVPRKKTMKKKKSQVKTESPDISPPSRSLRQENLDGTENGQYRSDATSKHEEDGYLISDPPTVETKSVGDLSDATSAKVAFLYARSNGANGDASPGRQSPADDTTSPVLSRKRRAKLVKNMHPEIEEKHHILLPKRQRPSFPQHQHQQPATYVINNFDETEDETTDSEINPSGIFLKKKPVWKRRKSAMVSYARVTKTFDPKPLNSPRKRYIVNKYGSPVDLRQGVEGTSVDIEPVTRFGGREIIPRPRSRNTSPSQSPYGWQQLQRLRRSRSRDVSPDTTHLAPSSDSDSHSHHRKRSPIDVRRLTEDLRHPAAAAAGETDLAVIHEDPSGEYSPVEQAQKWAEHGAAAAAAAANFMPPERSNSKKRSKSTVTRKRLKLKKNPSNPSNDKPPELQKKPPQELAKFAPRPTLASKAREVSKSREARPRQRFKPKPKSEPAQSATSVPHWQRSPVRWDRSNIPPRQSAKTTMKPQVKFLSPTEKAVSPKSPTQNMKSGDESTELFVEKTKEIQPPKSGLSRVVSSLFSWGS